VPDVTRAVDFWQRAFGLEVGFAHESGQYTELATGTTKLGFVAEALAAENGVHFRTNRLDGDPPAIEIALVTTELDAAWKRALAAGAVASRRPRSRGARW
jgi:lactoylglutathione lyase